WDLKHHVETAIKAHSLYKRDVEYVVKEGEVIIVDEFTGRLMPGRRWSDGLHQAVEAKEGVAIRKEDQTLATITFQNYFRMYKKLSGMTGTAETEAAEFDKIYKLDIVVIPTNRQMLRIENPDVVARQDLVNRSLARAVSAAEGSISPVAGPGMVRFYYQGQEFEVTQEQYDTAIRSHESAAKIEHDAVVAAGGLHILGTERH